LDSGLVFPWDAVNRGHIARHRVSPEEAKQVIEGEASEWPTNSKFLGS
jgi:hypothetical protein